MWLFMVVTCVTLLSANTEALIRRHVNPEGFMNISEIINYWGYPSERYQILTADGYYLQANRIPYGVHKPGNTGHRPAVLLVPGFVAEGRTWIANIPNNSLAFVLADVGYDVWLLNCRGTTWSRRHQTLSIDQEQFWDFSFHEMGIYDIPATINFILQKTKQDALYYVGHSQGATAGFIAFSVLPQLAQKVKLFMSFAPAYSMVGTKGACKMLLLLSEGVDKAIWGKKELAFLSNHMRNIVSKLGSYEGLDQLFIKLSFIITGHYEKNVNVSRVDVYAAILPDFTSVKTGLHWHQIFETKEFKYYDYGSKNKAVYNMNRPPFYKIEDMMVPTAVWYGGNDIVVSKEAIELLLLRIPHLVFQKFIPSWSHIDYMFGLDAPEYLYRDMLFLMQQYK